jgi:acetylornithine/N-succinyldiaminopimelate aminotransferase
VHGFDHVPFGNMNAVRDAITPQTAGIMIEPVQGEGGVRPADLRFLRDLRAVCDEFGLLLALDEVQTGMGPLRQALGAPVGGHRADVMSSARASAAASRSAPSWRRSRWPST